MYFSLISENYFFSSVNFVSVDNRESLYSTNHYHPTSSINPVVWVDSEGGSIKNVGPIVDCGDLSVSRLFAEILMSFDPFGIEYYPSQLKLEDGEVQNRYILAINNIIDVLDEERSDIEISPRSGELIVHELFISEEKLKQIPLSNRVAFRVKGAETAMFFCEELFDVIDFMAEFDSLRKAKISTDDLAPKF
ncbi:hypothetical protein V8038_003266 [Vibrio parahaemolyticus]|uniref:imm11 family protein n=1 Tax=Vibrio parahaemolyticus TaxID=670 RepID=UPI0004671F11|nr:DUF1629 domain-containing protein [Vibrio parahaemolyticus]EGQ8277353.1 hypothetical protein [Vibrio parahaemolyticus]EGQ8941865.1 hypothetical protein [Vibrio parahaemolyticus]EGQ8951246.1 hypothetical protein [Vibrio parahaemolyticus]EGQ8969267.1 hypothetical protein [Vibrio parahaemolyticus]EGR1153697.1 hypothetical protein [Vibrio parahaemolyticus]